jgi:chloramphenicol 3-O phosphotransferase
LEALNPTQKRPQGKVIFLNGASSSGKTTLALQLQNDLPEPFLYFSVDHFRDGNILPMARIRSGDFRWSEMREAVFEAFHRTIVAMTEAGCNVVAEHIIETEEWRPRLAGLFVDHDIFIVAVRCPNDELVRREQERGDRPIGDALRDAETCYDFCRHDLEVDSSLPTAENSMLIIKAWQNRQSELLSRFVQVEIER